MKILLIRGRVDLITEKRVSLWKNSVIVELD